MGNLQFIGLDSVSPELEQGKVKRIATEYHEKIERAIHNEVNLTLHIKSHTKGGKSIMWDVLGKAVAPNKKVFESSEEDWELPKCLHKVFKSILRQIEKAFV